MNPTQLSRELREALGVRILADVGTNLQLARQEWAGNKAFCAYCQAISALSIASAALAVPEVIKAVRTVTKQQ